uniref:Thioredoxin mMitochondrial-type n=1 Tax=Rhizophora mucronata TaxID=61149 RepID=A0A2P2ILS4_RHIMU
MATKSCFQVSTVSRTRATVSQPCHPIASIYTLHLPTKGNKEFNESNIPLSFYPSLSVRSSKSGYQSSRIVCKAREALDQVQEVTDSSWDKLVMSSDTPVLVEFWAPWCGPCRIIAPVIEELAKEHAGKIACYKVNTDQSPNIANKYGIRSIPTVLFFKNGERKQSVIGAVPKTTLSGAIEKYVEA